MVSKLPCVCITGPTASGKTGLALSLAREIPAEIVSMDSAMVYRGMDIGTAKPSLATRELVPHHLVDILEPTESYSAGRFAIDARALVEEIALRGRLPLIVGGTLLYLRALREGLARLPEASPAVRQALDEEAARAGWPALHERLASVDPGAAARIAPSDRQRVQRALEVYELTGQPLSELVETYASADSASGLEVVTFALIPSDRRALARRIAARFDAMAEAGFVSEVTRLRGRGDLSASTPAMRAVGYRQIWAYLDEDYGWAEARRRAIVATRRLAKRQLTWLRSEPATEALPVNPGEALNTGVLSRIQGACAKIAGGVNG